MMYTKSMIEHIFLIRKVAPSHIRVNIKLANPDLLDYLAQTYIELQDAKLKSLIERLLGMAGPAWLALINGVTNGPSRENQHIYRGRNLDTSAPSPSQNSKSPHVHKQTRIYRGQVISA